MALLEGLYRDGHSLGVCCVNVAELYSAIAEADREKTAELMDALSYFEVGRDAARLAGQYRYAFARSGIQLSAADAIVAATAVHHGATLATGNTAHYPMEDISLVALPRQ